MAPLKVFEIHLNLDDCQCLYDYIRQECLDRPENGWDLPSLVRRAQRSPEEVQRSKELIRSHNRIAKAHVDKGWLEKEKKQTKEDDDRFRPIFSDVFGQDDSTMLPPWVFPVFKAGDKIHGEVVMDVEEAVEAENVKIKFYGRANTMIAIHTDKHHSYHYEDEEYVKSKIILWQKPGSKEDLDSAISPHIQTGESIPTGRRKVPFEFDIPQNAQNSVPELRQGSSWIENYAHIAYYLKATINKGNVGKRGNIVIHQPIWVESQQDYDSTSYNSGPIKVVETKKVGFFSSNNVIHCRVNLPQKCFVKGDKIPVTVEVENKSDCEVYDVVARVEVRYHFGAVWSRYKPSRKETLEGDEVSAGAVSTGMSPIFKLDLPFEFPLCEGALMPAGPLKCKVIEFEYRINVEVKLKGMHRNLHVYLPIEIGKVNAGQVYPDLNKLSMK